MSFNFTVVSLISGVLHVTKWFEFTLLLISWWSVRVSANQDLQTSLHAIHLRDVTTFLTLLTGLGQLTSGYVCYTSIFYIHFTYQIQMLFYDNNYHLLRFFFYFEDFWQILANVINTMLMWMWILVMYGTPENLRLMHWLVMHVGIGEWAMPGKIRMLKL